MKNRKWFQTCMAGVLSAAMLTTSVSVWGAEFTDGEPVQEMAVEPVAELDVVEEVAVEEAVAEATVLAEEEVPELEEELFTAPEARASYVPVSSKYFPDAKFREYVSDKFDTNNDDKLSSTEISAAKTVDIRGLGVADLRGIERLTYAEELFASNNKLKTVNLTKNTKLKNINLNKNALTGTLDLSACTNMRIIQYADNALTKVVMPSYKYLAKVEYINVSHNKFQSQTYAGLKYIDNAYMKELEQVDASYNYMTEFNCSGFGGFLDLSCNKLTYISGGKRGYQATGLYLAGKYNTLSKVKVVDFSAVGNRIPQRLTYNPSAKSKFKMLTPSLRINPTWDKITLTVNCSADDVRYVLQKKKYGASSYQTIKTWAEGELDDPEFGENQYVDTNVSAGERYVYTLKTYVNVQNEDKKDVEWGASTGDTVYAAPPAPSISLKSSKKGYANIDWSAVEGATGYQVYYGISSSRATTALTKGTSRRYLNTSKPNSGKTYYFRVRAFKKVNGETKYGPFCTPKPLKIK